MKWNKIGSAYTYYLVLVIPGNYSKQTPFAPLPSRGKSISPFLTPAETKILVLLSASVERFGVSRMRDFSSKMAMLFKKFNMQLWSAM